MRRGILCMWWVGIAHFTRVFSSYWFPVIIKNTLTLSLLSLVVGFPMPIILALMLNEVNSGRFRKTFQTVSYAPHFISTVVMCGMLVIFTNPKHGIFNIRMMDYMYTDEGELAGTFDAEGETFDWYHNDLLDVDVPKMRVLEGCASGEETRYKYATLNETLNVIEWNNDRRALFTADLDVVGSDEILTEYGWAALVALAVRQDGIQTVDCVPKLSYTAEEANERATLQTDIENDIKQAKAQFITGEIGVDEGWDDFVSTLQNMGVDRLVEIEQAAYDRYVEVVG